MPPKTKLASTLGRSMNFSPIDGGRELSESATPEMLPGQCQNAHRAVHLTLELHGRDYDHRSRIWHSFQVRDVFEVIYAVSQRVPVHIKGLRRPPIDAQGIDSKGQYRASLH